MAVTSVYELAIPSEHAASFVNGERALSVSSSIAGAPARTTFYLSKWFDLQGGVYTLRSLAQDAALWMASVSVNNGRVFFNSTASQGVGDAEVYLPQGRHRIDIVLPNTSTVASSCFVAFSLIQGNRLVYASAAAGWVFDTAPIADSAVPTLAEPDTVLPVFTVLPNWANGVTERLDYKTEIITDEGDVEQRRSLRRYPRRSFEASFARHDVRRARLQNFLIGSGNNEVLVPLWHEQHTVSSILGLNVQFPDGELGLREFNPGDLVFVNRGNPVEHEVLRVASVDTSTDVLTFTQAPTLPWPAGTRIYPLRRARVLESSSMENVTDRVGTVQIRFSLSEPEAWPAGAWATCTPLFSFPVDWSSQVSHTFSRPAASVIDNDYGKTEVFDFFGTSRGSVRAAMTLRGRQRMYAFRQFVQNARGRAVRFWMPSLTDDLRCTSPTIGGDYIDVSNAGLADYISRDQELRSMLAIEFADGRSTIYREIESITENGETERLFLTKVLPAAPGDLVSRIMFITPSRFDQDGFELMHYVDGSKAVKTSVIVRSVDGAGMPGLECNTTSRPYPVVSVESFNAAASFLAGVIRENLIVREEARSVASFIGGSVIVNTESLTADPHAISLVPMFLGGSFDTDTQAFNFGPYAVSSGASFIAGEIDTVLVAYSNNPGSVGVSASFIGGSLPLPGDYLIKMNMDGTDGQTENIENAGTLGGNFTANAVEASLRTAAARYGSTGLRTRWFLEDSSLAQISSPLLLNSGAQSKGTIGCYFNANNTTDANGAGYLTPIEWTLDNELPGNVVSIAFTRRSSGVVVNFGFYGQGTNALAGDFFEANLNLTSWWHVEFGWTNGTYYIFINGNLVSTGSIRFGDAVGSSGSLILSRVRSWPFNSFVFTDNYYVHSDCLHTASFTPGPLPGA